MADDKQTATSFGLMKYVHLTFLAGAVIGGWLLSNIIQTVWKSLNIAWVEVPTPSLALSILAGSGVAVSVAVYLWRHPQINKLVVEIVTELSKVTWPTRKELSSSTVVVVVVSVIAALILGAFDAFWSWVTGFIY